MTCHSIDTGLIEAEALHFAGWMHSKLLKQAPAKTPQEAFEMTKQALELRLQRLPKDDPIVGGSYGNLAMFTVATGDYESSLKYSQDCLDIRMLNESNETTNISVTHNYIGWCYAKMGDAETRKAHDLRVEGHDAEANTHLKKANDYYEAAEAKFKEGIDVILRNFGDGAKKGPQIIWPTYGLGNLYLSLGRENEAYQRHADARDIGISLYGGSSPRVFFWQYKMAWYELRKGNLNVAKTQATDLLNEMLNQGFYDGHIARTQYFLSVVLERLGETMESEGMRNTAVEIARSLNGPEWEIKNGEQDFDDLVFFHDR